MNYKEARDLLDGKGKKRGPRDSLKIARNTYLERGREFSCYSHGAMGRTEDYPKNAIGLRFHNTYVAILTPHWTELYSGGWYTMTTADRMRYVVGISSSKGGGGWQVDLIRDGLPCHCLERQNDWTKGEHAGIVIEGEYRPGLDLKWTNEYLYQGRRYLNENPTPYVTTDDPDRAKPIYTWAPCSVCKGTGRRTGIDWANGHPYFDGIRISADRRRLMRQQPHKPRSYAPVYTHSGW